MDNIEIVWTGWIKLVKSGKVYTVDDQCFNMEVEPLWLMWSIDVEVMMKKFVYPIEIEIGYINGNPYVELL